MTPTTSSALSDTLRARNRVAGHARRGPADDLGPAARAGRHVDARAGARRAARRRARHPSPTCTADSTSCASPTTSIESARSAFRPDRKIEWSSTTTTRTVVRASDASATAVLRSRPLGGVAQPHLGADPADAGPDLARAADSAHASDDRLAHTEPVARHVGEREAGRRGRARTPRPLPGSTRRTPRPLRRRASPHSAWPHGPPPRARRSPARATPRPRPRRT